MKTNYTKGEWKIGLPKKKKKSYAFINSENWVGLAKVVVRFKYSKKFDKQGMANAKLIAAAPDLLEALIELTELYSSAVDDETTITEMKQTIKKATE